MTRRVAAAFLAVLVATGCSAPASDPDAGPAAAAAPESPSDAELAERAGLEPCPPSGPTGGGSSVGAGTSGGAGSSGGAGTSRLPEAPLPCLGEGPEVSLAGLEGEPTVVNLWASWCGPCVEELPALQALHSASQVRVLGVLTQDTVRQGLAAAGGLGVTFPSVVDDAGEVRRSLGLQVLPATVLLRPDGTVAHRYVGPALDEPTLRSLLAEHLGVAG